MRKNKYNKSKAPKKNSNYKHDPCLATTPKPPRTTHREDNVALLLKAQAETLKAKYEAEAKERERMFNAQLNILLQFAEDACVISTAEVRGLGAANAQTLRVKHREVINEMSALLADDEDKEIVYGRAKIDGALARIEGVKNAKAWDDRLAWCFIPVEGKV